MSTIGDLLTTGLPLDWTTILVGWQGVGGRVRLVSPEEVIAYASSQLLSARQAGANDATLGCLSVVRSHDEEAIGQYLRELAASEGNAAARHERAVRTWRFVLLRELLRDLPDDPVNGLLELTNFWAGFNFPRDMPHVVQGLNNELTPDEYYTEDTFCRLRRDHVNWLLSEEATLRRNVISDEQ